MYENNQLWNIYFLRSQRISYRYRETHWWPGIYIIDLNRLFFFLIILVNNQQAKVLFFLPELLFNYIVFEFTLLLMVLPWYSENYIDTISCTWEWASTLSSSDSLKGKEAIKEKLDSIIKNDVWELVEFPKDRKAIGSKWIL